jgi:hypothetical protein
MDFLVNGCNDLIQCSSSVWLSFQLEERPGNVFYENNLSKSQQSLL